MTLDASWMKDAACRTGVDPEIFFPEHGGRLANANEAIALCRRCPVVSECLQYALELDRTYFSSWGIWGGTSQGQRDRLARQRRPAPAVRRV